MTQLTLNYAAQSHSPTSRAGLAAVPVTQRDRVLAHIRACGGCTDLEGSAATGIRLTSWLGRRAEGVKLGLIRDSGRTKLSPAGLSNVIWEALA